MRRLSTSLLTFIALACNDAQPPRQPDSFAPSTQEVLTYRVCPSANPGELVPLPRDVSADQDPVTAALAELVKGVNESEAAQGCHSYFSGRTQDALIGVHGYPGDTIHVDFRNFAAALPDEPLVKSFLPPGIMAELTSTLFQFDEIQAVRFSFDGDERAFWEWLGGPGTPVQAFTRRHWEQI